MGDEDNFCAIEGVLMEAALAEAETSYRIRRLEKCRADLLAALAGLFLELTEENWEKARATFEEWSL